MLSLFLRNLFFTILQPGMVAGLIPFRILGSKVKTTFDQPIKFSHISGTLLFVIGLIITLICIVSFALQGRGTLSPADPTKKLVVAGLYRYSRNPMYAGVTLMLIGEAIFFESPVLWIYSLLILAAFNIYIRFFEEARLRKDFGEDYDNYCKKTRKWI